MKAAVYLRDLTQAGDFSSVRVHGEEHGGGLRRLRLEQLERLVQGLKDETNGKQEAPTADRKPPSPFPTILCSQTTWGPQGFLRGSSPSQRLPSPSP